MGVFFWFLVVVLIGWGLFLYVIPFLIKLYLKRLAERFKNQAQQSSKPEKKEGSVNIDYIPEKHTEKEKEAPGDYVNFEEIDEK